MYTYRKISLCRSLMATGLTFVLSAGAWLVYKVHEERKCDGEKQEECKTTGFWEFFRRTWPKPRRR